VSSWPHMLAALPPGKELWHHLNRRLGGSDRQSGCFRKEKISWPLPRFEPWIIQLELSIDNV